MEVIINISPLGAGTVTGGGTHGEGDSVTLTATATKASHPLKHYLVDGVIQSANPYEFVAPATDVNVEAIFDYSFEGWLQSQIQIEMSEDTLVGVMINRGVPIDAMLLDVTEKLRWLCVADCCVLILTNWTENTEKMQGWTSTRKLTYSDDLKDLANRLYDKWDEDTIIGRSARIRKWV